MNYVRLAANAAGDRNAVITEVVDAFQSVGGDLMGYEHFSNLATSLRFEMPVDAAGKLEAALDATRIKLDAESREALRAVQGSGKLVVAMFLLFKDGDGTLVIEKPLG